MAADLASAAAQFASMADKAAGVAADLAPSAAPVPAVARITADTIPLIDITVLLFSETL